MQYQLRLAGSDEAGALARLMVDSFLAAYGHLAPADSIARHIAQHYDAGRISARIAAGQIEVHLAQQGAALAGYLQLGFGVPPPTPLAGRRALEVQRCYLLPEHIGGGAAALLMARAQQRARECGAQALHLSVYQQAPRALRFYEKHGFRRSLAIKYWIDSVEFDDWLMLWEA